MNILFVGADKTNPTDGVIVKGIYNLVEKAYPGFKSEYIFLDDHNEMSISSIYPMNNFDLIIVCGTPWLWDSFQKSVKYSNLKFIFHIHDKAKRLFMGIGTCVNLEDVSSEILRRKDEIQGMKDLFNDSTVIVRDELSRELLSDAKIESTLLPCPAYFCYNDFNFTTKKDNISIWCDPRKTISKSNWVDEKKYKDYCNTFLAFNDFYNPKVYCAFPEEVESAVKIGLPEPTILYTFQDTMDIMMTGDNVLSGRVHCAVPAFSAGCNTTLVPIDSRALMFNLFEDIKDKEQNYMYILKNMI